MANRWMYLVFLVIVGLLTACSQQTTPLAPAIQGSGTVSKQSGITTVVSDQASCEAIGGSYVPYKNQCDIFNSDITVAAGDTLQASSCLVTTQGFTVNGILNVEATGCLGLNTPDKFSNTGTINLNHFMQFNSPGSATNAGTININSGGTLKTFALTSFTNKGTIVINDGGNITLSRTDGTFTNNGVIKQYCGTFTLNGTYSGNPVQDLCPPSVKVEKASTQVDPTTASPIHFTATFSEPVTGFTNADVTLSGTAGATTATVSEIAPNNRTTYDIAVSGMTTGGTVIASIPADKVTDAAGNKNTASTSTDNTVTFVADTTAPTTTITPDPTKPDSGWYKTAVTLKVSASDASGVAETRCIMDPSSVPSSFDDLPASCGYTGSGASVSSDGSHTLYAASKDTVGNKESIQSLSLKIDTTIPTISAAASAFANANGWYNTNVTVHFTCNDTLSGIASCPTDQSLSNEGSSVSSTAGTATDKAGNTSASSNVVTVKIDKTAPTITLTTPTQNAQYLQYQSVTPIYNCTDASGASGVASCTSSAFSTATTGSKTFTVNASDNAGNISIQSVSYSVISASSGVGNLINQVKALNLDKNTANSFTSLLQNVQADLSKNNKAGALDKLTSFIAQVNAQRGKKISNAQADSLIAYANLIIASIKAAP